MRRHDSSRRRGIALIYLILIMVALVGFCSLAVDYGHVQVVKTELQVAADAAARHGAGGLRTGITETQDRAIAAAQDNRTDQQAIALDREGDIEFGTWTQSTRTFSPLSGAARASANAVRVTARRIAARSNPVNLTFASIVGRPTFDVEAQSVASIGPVYSAFIGLNDITVKNNLYSGGYDSSVDTDPTAGEYHNAGALGSNGAITAKNNELVGQLALGPSGSHNLDLAPPAAVIHLEQPIPTPAVFASPAPGTNPDGSARGSALTVNGQKWMPGGTYYFSSITLNNNARLNFLAAATVYVEGNITFSQMGQITAYNSVPGNLRIRQKGAGTVFGGANANTVIVIGDVEAPQTALSAKNMARLLGRGLFNSITADNNAEFFYDEQLNAVVPGLERSGFVSLVR